ncbi:hypothetical protein PC116_g33121 [Phytophthora cactorum]|nr:hypothetical protein PC116_g33121 [Phytophthora cactorum]
MMEYIAAFRHLHAEELALQVDASSLLRTTVERLQARPRSPRFLAVVNHMMVVRVHVEQHQSERDVAGLDVVVLDPRVREARSHLAVHHMPHRLGQEHATHVAAPRRVVVSVELVDGDLGGGIVGRGHGAWAHNLMDSMDLGHRRLDEAEGGSTLGETGVEAGNHLRGRGKIRK